MTTLYYTKYFTPNILQSIIAADFANVKLATSELNKKNDPIALVTPDGILTQPNAILRFICDNTNLNGKS
jgi:hypothetical protein